MRAAILAVGSELLGVDRLDTNSLRLTEVLQRFGVVLEHKAVVGDDEAVIAREIARALTIFDLILVTGGLGPTADDVTRQATATALGRGRAIDESLVEEMRRLFAGFGRTMPEVNRRQAEIVDGAVVLKNPAGTACGQRLEQDGATIFLFPGVPRELEAMIPLHLEPFLVERCGRDQGIERRVLKVACLPESVVEEKIAPAYQLFGRENIMVLASPGEVKVFALAQGSREARHQRLEQMAAELRRLIGKAVFTEDESETLESVVVKRLLAEDKTVVVAESCTGGLIGERLTAIPGSSATFQGGIIAYSYELKTELLGVSADLLAQHGAVSEIVVKQMALGGRERLHADYCLAVSGIAGPGGATEEKPVGTVHLALAFPGKTGEAAVEHRHARFPGDRERVRRMASQLALEMLRRRLEASDAP